MVRVYNEGTCNELSEYAEYDGPAGGGDAPNATIVVSQAIFITGSSDGADNQKDIITVKFDVNTGLNEPVNAEGLTFVYPNPFNGSAVIKISDELSAANENSVKIFNVLGEEVYSVEHAGNVVALDKADFANGIYSYKVFNAGRPVAGGRFVTN